MMELMIQEGTCYTDTNIPCVTYPNTRADWSEFNARATNSAFDANDKNVEFEVKDAQGNVVNIIHTGVRLNFYYLNHITGNTLRTILNDCENKGHTLEAHSRFMNAVESAAISAVSDFCELSVKLLADQRLMMNACNSFCDLLELIRIKFSQFNVWFEPIQQVERAALVMRQPNQDQSKANRFFETACQDFTERFDNMAGLLKRGQPSRRVGNLPINEVFIALQETIARDTFIFKDTTPKLEE